MKYEKKQMNLDDGLTREWIITNGIGGYSSSTILGCNTRKYHGLLVAPLTPPARRFVMLSKLDEAIEIEGKTYPLYTNVCENYISKGYQSLESFEKEVLPIFTYQIDEIKIKKVICMDYGKNTVCIYYKVTNGNKKIKLTLAPIVTFRDFHTLHEKNYEVEQSVSKQKVKLIIDHQKETPLYMHVTEGNYQSYENNYFKNMYYIEEEKRGFYPKEDLVVPGCYEIEINPGEEKEIYFKASLEENIEEIDVKKVINHEIIRVNEQMIQSNLIDIKKEKETDEDKKYRNMIQNYIIASDQFIVNRPRFGLHTIIAGYPWFLDWGRDSMIAFEGLLLLPRRFEIAKEVLLTFIRDIKYGLVPNGYSGFDNRPLYNSVDASLLLFEQVKKYLDYTGDDSFVKKEIYPHLKEIMKAYQTGIDLDDNNIHLEEDNLISSGTPYTQNTWMDAKYGNMPATPRNGKVVEVNALWYNSLKIMEFLSSKYEGKEEASCYQILAEKTRKSFVQKFYNKRRKALYDVLGDSKIRPNQLFALATSYPVIDPTSEVAEQIIEVTNKKLYNPYGLKTLAKGEKGYVDVYEGDSFKRDMSYHQGITWPWLLGLYYNALKNMIQYQKTKTKKTNYQNKLNELVELTKETFLKEIDNRGMIGSIAEIYDSKKPYTPKGAPAQAWSVAEVFRIILKK